MEPYADSVEHLLEELERLDLLLRRYLREWRRDRGGSDDKVGGLYVSDEEVDRLLSIPSDDGHNSASDTGASGISKRRRVHVDGAHTQTDTSNHGGEAPTRTHAGRGKHRTTADKLTARIEDCSRRIQGRMAATSETGLSLRLTTLTERFALEPRQVDALLIALAPELDRKYRTIYGYLRDDVTKSRPTVDLTLDVLRETESERLAARRIFSGTSPLVGNRLVRVVGNERTPTGSREVAVAERVVEFLLGNDDVAAGLADRAAIISPEASLDDLIVDDETAGTLASLERTRAEAADSETTRDGSNPQMTYVYGPSGVGKSTAIDALCAASESPLVRADADIFVDGDLEETVKLLSREVTLQGAGLHVEHLVPLQEGAEFDVEDVLRVLDDVDGDVFLSGTEPLSTYRPGGVETHEFSAVELPIPPYERRQERWAAVETLPDEVDPSELAATFRLTSGQIADAVAVAETLSDGDWLDPAAIYEGCRSQSTEELGTLARAVDPHYTWADIVLPPAEMRRLREVAAHVTNQGRVYADWGFGEKFSHGNGLVVLFNGPSGTGKTMAADIIAGETGLDLYKIDLANVVSKYIGETEKNLGRIFDEAANSNAILLFDEADALFGERTDVSDAHDRYANIEVNYLLQRIEEHEGTVILTTNLEGNIDDAFRRRIHVRLDFPVPDRDSREAIWRTVFPDDTPVGSVDFDFLSTFEVTGGNIRNIALTAAFLAADGADSVEMDHIITAAKQEFEKMGKLVPTDEFEAYQDTANREGR